MAAYEGRLELTWTNKRLRLLAHEDGAYEWVEPADFRVAEVRLLHDAGSVGAVAPAAARATDNLLIQGDALNALTSLIELPEFARHYLGKVKLAYLDPPFNTQQSFLQYDDALEHSVWLTMMRDRLAQVKTLLAPAGSVWVHCDDSEQAYLKVMMDELFGRENFVGTMIWQKRFSRSNDATISVSHDYIVVFARDRNKLAWNRLAATTEQSDRYANPDDDPRGPWASVSFNAPNIRPNLTYPIIGPAGKEFFPPAGRHWSTTQQEYERLNAEGRIWFGADGTGVPRLKRYWNEGATGLTPWTWWPYEEVGHTQESQREIQKLFPGEVAFSTPKPERLLSRIVHIATDPGDIVLDCFLGSGTTAAVAHKMGRRWVGVERSAETVETYARPRLQKVVAGEDPGGVTEAVGWEGGGGFRVLTVSPSMFEAVDGHVALAGWATNGALSEATAAQLGFDHAVDVPFSGRRGRARLAVVDGLVNAAVVELLIGALGDGETLVAAGTAVDPAARAAARALRPGSTVRKIPRSILQEYRQAARWLQTTLPAEAPNGADAPATAEVPAPATAAPAVAPAATADAAAAPA